MARSYMCGFEMNALGESSTSAAGNDVQTAIRHGGSYAMHVAAGGSNITFRSRAAGGTLRVIFGSLRFYYYFTALPASSTNFYAISGGAIVLTLALTTTGALRLAAGANTDDSTLTLTTNTWYRIAIDTGTTTAAVYVNGVLFASVSPNTVASIGTGAVFSTLGTGDQYIDDAIWDDGSAVIGLGQQILLLPTADSSIGSWTGGAGSTTNLWDAVNNIPPIGVAAADETDLTQIKTSAKSSTDDYIATMQTYLAAGIPAGSKINAVMAITAGGEAVGTGTKVGSIAGNSSNPSVGAQGFDFGGDIGAVGIWPSNWAIEVSPVAADPSVTLGTAPTVNVRNADSGSTRQKCVCFLGLYVDYDMSPLTPMFQPLTSQPYGYKNEIVFY